MDFSDCPCTGRTLDKLVKPLVMTFLAKGQLHGYGIQRLLESQGSFAHGPPDLSGVYRSLKEMESQGYVESSWISNDGGPPKRCFSLTENGRACLAVWKKTLIDYRAQIDELIGFMDELSPEELGGFEVEGKGKGGRP
ncbi:MAG: PadR family transcriptional regulator [Deltaproteobacteria bacterium]|jgi:DNA-binding PadR family transcriptional regulator|nr:PadR family transcriptional regulator [Deltaproteobacteria bacterium]